MDGTVVSQHRERCGRSRKRPVKKRLGWGWQKQDAHIARNDNVGGPASVTRDEERVRRGWTEMRLCGYGRWVVVKTLSLYSMSEGSLYSMRSVVLSQWQDDHVHLLRAAYFIARSRRRVCRHCTLNIRLWHLYTNHATLLQVTILYTVSQKTSHLQLARTLTQERIFIFLAKMLPIK